MRNFIFVALFVLLSGWAQADPDADIEKARQACLSQLPANYKVEGYRGVSHLPRMRPDYSGVLVLTPRAEGFGVTIKVPEGEFHGLALLDNGRLISGKNIVFQLSVSVTDKKGKPVARLYTVETPHMAEDPWILSGSWLSESGRGYERAIQIQR